MKINPLESLANKTTEAPAYSVVEDKEGRLLIEGTPSQVKESVFNFLEKNVSLISKAEYKKRYGHEGIAHFEGTLGTIDNGKAIVVAKIFLNKDAFISQGDDYSDLIPLVIRHEVEELWTYAKTGYSFVPTPKSLDDEKIVALGHGLALRKQYEYAFETEKADRLLKFIVRHISNDSDCSQNNRDAQIEENINAYNLEKRRYEERLKR